MSTLELSTHSAVATTTEATVGVKNVMSGTDTFADARVEFAGVVWDVDHTPHDVFKIERAGEPALYGDYFLVSPSDNENEFNTEIGLFGYLGRLDVGNPDPTLRQQFAGEERQAVERLIRSYFSNPNVFDDQFLPPVRCLGGVSFRPNWIIQKSPE
jgi:hypothetical protein